MTNGLDLFAHWSVRQKLNLVSSVQLRRSVRVLSLVSTQRNVRKIRNETPLLSFRFGPCHA